MSEINVTPFVDVMLVLLIVFMVTAPLLTLTIRVDLPDTRGGTALNSDKAPLTITLKKSGGQCSSQADLFLDKTPLALEQIEGSIGRGAGKRVGHEGRPVHERVARIVGPERLKDFSSRQGGGER